MQEKIRRVDDKAEVYKKGLKKYGEEEKRGKTKVG